MFGKSITQLFKFPGIEFPYTGPVSLQLLSLSNMFKPAILLSWGILLAEA